MNDDQFAALLKKKISSRRWRTIVGLWVEDLPVIDPPLTPPENISEFYPLATRINAAKRENVSEFSDQIEGLRELVFHEGVFLFHKAVNVLSAAEIQADEGMHTWSLSSAYHSALFCAKAVSCLLGVCTVVDEKGGYWLVDVFPSSTQLPYNKRGAEDLTTQDISILKATVRVEHRHVWRLFIRLIGATTFTDEILKKLKNSLQAMTDADFSKQRNSIHYKNDVWIFDDLYGLSSATRFGIRERPINIKDERKKDDFSMVLSYSLIELGRRLMKEISGLSNKVGLEMEAIESSLTDARHPIYMASQPAFDLTAR